ncbi:MAG: tripartite tricarboxylate transporter substrate binding protein [Burkholderiales bacterium]|nr:tripartite tricarboxylate transporter substrate binding protein [Burkholderiales bacterium]
MKLLPIFATALLAYGAALHAQQFPERSLRIVVPVAPGGANDILARTIGPRLSEAWGQQVLVENRAGGGGTIGAGFVAKARPDGHTLAVASISHIVLAPTVLTEKPYDPLRDFSAVTQLVNQPIVLAAHPSFPARSIKELVAVAKSRPGELTYGSTGIGSAMHLAGELLQQRTGTHLVHVPYKGGAPALVELTGGHVPLLFVGLAPALPHIRNGRIKALAVAGAQRASVLQATPTIGEALPGYQVNFWVGVLAPGATPGATVAVIHREIIRILGIPDVHTALRDASFDVVGSSPAQFAKSVAEDVRRWTPVIRIAGIKPE